MSEESRLGLVSPLKMPSKPSVSESSIYILLYKYFSGVFWLVSRVFI